jgi:hypothetical protein
VRSETALAHSSGVESRFENQRSFDIPGKVMSLLDCAAIFNARGC